MEIFVYLCNIIGVGLIKKSSLHNNALWSTICSISLWASHWSFTHYEDYGGIGHININIKF